ncbi:type IV pilus modification protein PilV [Vreelandella rituensis]|uniref:Type IV pilus modification protein PilV n=1 Tax=Vreelandella rituensis TaxID=2282306 RepID=A0A368U0G8_9GAMM|nr:type IV pilus modification protein PilV [Halomonas rituensis]RCV90321.1 type IV pilus modification protein PilV [Halomonas rituensis]
MSQKGFSLIEALIALVILSMGLMGVAAMQLKALQSATAGYQRSVATLAAVDAQERLWARLPDLAENGQDCKNIDIDSVETAWKNWWSIDEASNPLRNALWGESRIEPAQSEDNQDIDCEFTITIELSDGPGDIDTDIFTYNLRLPEKP